MIDLLSSVRIYGLKLYDLTMIGTISHLCAAHIRSKGQPPFGGVVLDFCERSISGRFVFITCSKSWPFLYSQFSSLPLAAARRVFGMHGCLIL